jgi:uncharacterized membrane protein YgaE (UPF0421/DUF939 family)
VVRRVANKLQAVKDKVKRAAADKAKRAANKVTKRAASKAAKRAVHRTANLNQQRREMRLDRSYLALFVCVLINWCERWEPGNDYECG